MRGSYGSSGGAAGALISLIYLAFAALYFFPALFLWRYGGHIRQLVATHRAGDLESALEAQKSFWKFIGIVTTILVAISAGSLGSAGALAASLAVAVVAVVWAEPSVAAANAMTATPAVAKTILFIQQLLPRRWLTAPRR